MASHPFLASQPEVVERVAAVIPTPEASMCVPEWPEDEAEFFRTGFDTWHSFSEREEMLGRIRKVKAARAVLLALEIVVPPEPGIDPLAVRCPHCGAKPSRECRPPGPSVVDGRYHVARAQVPQVPQ